MSRIIGPSSATYTHLSDALTDMGDAVHPRFILEIVPAIWSAAYTFDLDGVGLVAQSAKETGWGHFRGNVPAAFCNPCGLKVREVATVKKLIGETAHDDHPLVHAQFPSWQVGAIAHAQHVRAYAGWPVDVNVSPVLSPRYHLVVGRYKNENWREFGGVRGGWAPSNTYGQEIEDIMYRLVNWERR